MRKTKSHNIKKNKFSTFWDLLTLILSHVWQKIIIFIFENILIFKKGNFQQCLKVENRRLRTKFFQDMELFYFYFKSRCENEFKDNFEKNAFNSPMEFPKKSFLVKLTIMVFSEITRHLGSSKPHFGNQNFLNERFLEQE